MRPDLLASIGKLFMIGALNHLSELTCSPNLGFLKRIDCGRDKNNTHKMCA
jgi:hypothetical protein